MTSDESDDASEISDFWADEAAERVIENRPSPVVKGGVSPSGVPHVGNFNEIARGYFVVRALERKGQDARQVFTSDDRDPLRRVPDTVLSPEGELVELDEEEKEELSEHLGKPYVDVPSPFGDDDRSWADHFSSFLRDDAERMSVDIEFHSNDEMYADGRFDDNIRKALSNLETSRDVIQRFQRTADEDYIPFMPICDECGRITPTATDVDLEDETVGYVCEDTDLGGETIEGCGHEGRATFREGKLPWRFEWPAQWDVLDVGFEPFGKDHAEGSWESGVAIAEEVYGIEPPEPLVYEFFLVDGDKMSASEGDVYTVEELLRYLEPAVLRYFFALDPTKQRDLPMTDFHHLANEFDRVEDVHYGRIEPADEKEELYAERVYPDLVPDLGVEEPLRPTYTHAAMVGIAPTEEARLAALERSGYVDDDFTEAQKRISLQRVELARNWAVELGNRYGVEVLDEVPEDFKANDETRVAFGELADVVESGADGDEIQDSIFSIARDHGIRVGDFFSDGYELFLGQADGPKLGPLLAVLDREFVVERLREVAEEPEEDDEETEDE